MPYMDKDVYAGKNRIKAGSSKSNASSECKRCRTRFNKAGAALCISCASKHVECQLCGVSVMDGKLKAQYKNSQK